MKKWTRRLKCTRCNGGHIQKRKLEGKWRGKWILHCLQPFQRVNDPRLLGRDQRNGEDSTTGKICRNIRVGTSRDLDDHGEPAAGSYWFD
jgi:hypothetical protein